MTAAAHYARLQRIYRANACNQYYTTEIDISYGEARLQLPLRPDFLHAGGVIHGSVYFKLLDDTGTFAAMSLAEDAGVVTASYNLYFMRPVAAGTIYAHGRVVHQSRRLFIAESVVTDENERELARGSGTFMRMQIAK